MSLFKKRYTYIYYIILIVVLYILYITTQNIKEYFSQSIPKRIWTYWNEKTITKKTVRLCIESWKKYNPDYEITIVNPSNLKYFIDLDVKKLKMNDGPARESDIIRINILEKYGGVWVDATILMTAALEFPTDDYEFYGFKIDSFISKENIPVIESWFFATVPHGKFITAWRNEFMKAEKYASIKDALQALKDEGVQYDKISGPEYLFIHVCAQKILQKEMTLDEIKKTFFLLKAEDTAFKYLSANNWDTIRGIESLCRGENITPIIKFRGSERGYLEKNQDKIDCIMKPHV